MDKHAMSEADFVGQYGRLPTGFERAVNGIPTPGGKLSNSAADPFIGIALAILFAGAGLAIGAEAISRMQGQTVDIRVHVAPQADASRR